MCLDSEAGYKKKEEIKSGKRIRSSKEGRGRRSTRVIVRGVRNRWKGIVNACQVGADLWLDGE